MGEEMRLNEFKFENDIESKIDEFGILSTLLFLNLILLCQGLS